MPRDTERHGATMVRYVLRAGGLAEPSGGWLGVPADRRPRGLALPRLAEWSVLKLGGYDPTVVAWRLADGLHLLASAALARLPHDGGTAGCGFLEQVLAHGLQTCRVGKTCDLDLTQHLGAAACRGFY